MFLDVLIAALGLLLVLFVLGSVSRTTLTLRGGGPIANTVTSLVWGLTRLLCRLTGSRRASYGAGVASLLCGVASWLLLLWLGWLFVFLPFPDAVTSSAGVPADLWSRVYFVGFSLITLGVGDYVPGGPFFRVATVVCAASGFFLITLAVTYMIPVVTAMVSARQLATHIFLLGDTPAGVAQKVSSSDPEFEAIVGNLPAPILLLAQRYFAYPVLHYFPSDQRNASITLALTVLDEALTLLVLTSRRDSKSMPALAVTLRKALDTYFGYLGDRFLSQEESGPPPVPRVEELRGTGLDVVDQAELDRRYSTLSPRRSQLLALVHHDLRDWSQVYEAAESPRGP